MGGWNTGCNTGTGWYIGITDGLEKRFIPCVDEQPRERDSGEMKCIEDIADIASMLTANTQ